MPAHFSMSAVDLIRRFLRVDPTRRLGHTKGGTREIKQHPFFADINWQVRSTTHRSFVHYILFFLVLMLNTHTHFSSQEIEKREAFGPIIPHLEGAGDTRNYQGTARSEEDAEALKQTLQPDISIPSEIEDLFADF